MNPSYLRTQNLRRRSMPHLPRRGLGAWTLDLDELCEDPETDSDDDDGFGGFSWLYGDSQNPGTAKIGGRETVAEKRKKARKAKKKKKTKKKRKDDVDSAPTGQQTPLLNPDQQPDINTNTKHDIPMEYIDAGSHKDDSSQDESGESDVSSEDSSSDDDGTLKEYHDFTPENKEEPGPRLGRLRLQNVVGLKQYYADPETFKQELLQEMEKDKVVQQQAEVEVLVHHLLEDHKPEGAVLYVAKEVDPEPKVKFMASALLRKGAVLPESDLEKMAIYHAVSRGHCQVLNKLLKAKGMPQSKERQFRLLQKALENFQESNDDIAALLISYMSKAFVRGLFSMLFRQPPRLNLHNLLKSSMQKTILAVLDCLIETTEDGRIKMHYKLLESDEKGLTPKDDTYSTSNRSALHVIADTENKDAVYHDVVRQLLRRKWHTRGRRVFSIFAVQFLFSLFLMTFALVVASGCKDPVVYNSPLQYARAAAELLVCVDLLINLILLLIQMYYRGLPFFKIARNWLDLVSILLPLVVVPLRFLATKQSWPVFGVGYFLWTMRIFKYSSASRSLGTLARTFSGFLTKDIVQFLALFAVVLLAFSGLLLAGLTYEDAAGRYWETNSYWTTLLTGLRTLVEQSNIIDYVGKDGLGPFCVTVILLFLLTTLVVMINILVAQLSSTYDCVLADAERALELDRLQFITHRERNPFTDRRKRFYIPVEDVTRVFQNNMKSAQRTSGKAQMLNELKNKLEQQDLHLHSLSLQMHHLLDTTHIIQQHLGIQPRGPSGR